MCNCHELDKYTMCEECVVEMYTGFIPCRVCGIEINENPSARWDWLDVYGNICKTCLEVEEERGQKAVHAYWVKLSLNSSEL